jgi:hypothetical protein
MSGRYETKLALLEFATCEAELGAQHNMLGRSKKRMCKTLLLVTEKDEVAIETI